MSEPSPTRTTPKICVGDLVEIPSPLLGVGAVASAAASVGLLGVLGAALWTPVGWILGKKNSRVSARGRVLDIRHDSNIVRLTLKTSTSILEVALSALEMQLLSVVERGPQSDEELISELERDISIDEAKALTGLIHRIDGNLSRTERALDVAFARLQGSR